MLPCHRSRCQRALSTTNTTPHHALHLPLSSAAAAVLALPSMPCSTLQASFQVFSCSPAECVWAQDGGEEAGRGAGAQRMYRPSAERASVHPAAHGSLAWPARSGSYAHTPPRARGPSPPAHPHQATTRPAPCLALHFKGHVCDPAILAPLGACPQHTRPFPCRRREARRQPRRRAHLRARRRGTCLRSCPCGRPPRPCRRRPSTAPGHRQTPRPSCRRRWWWCRSWGTAAHSCVGGGGRAVWLCRVGVASVAGDGGAAGVGRVACWTQGKGGVEVSSVLCGGKGLGWGDHGVVPTASCVARVTLSAGQGIRSGGVRDGPILPALPCRPSCHPQVGCSYFKFE